MSELKKVIVENAPQPRSRKSRKFRLAVKVMLLAGFLLVVAAPQLPRTEARAEISEPEIPLALVPVLLLGSYAGLYRIRRKFVGQK